MSGSHTGPRIIGLDLSLTGTGWACADGMGTIGSTGKKGDDLRKHAARIDDLSARVLRQVVAVRAQLVVVEGPAFGAKGNAGHILAGFWWRIICDLLTEGLLLAEVSPGTLKRYITGSGNSDKADVRGALARRLPSYHPADDDQADALVLYAMGRDYYGNPIAVMPAAQREALAKVAWPQINGGE